MKYLIVFIAMMAVGLGCGKSEKNPREGNGHEKPGVQRQGPRAENEEATAVAKTGPGLAVEAYEVEEGRIKLSERAEKRLGVRSETVIFRDGVVRVPTQALGHEEGESFLYVREKEGWLKRTFVMVGPRSGGESPVLAGLTPGAEVVVQGAALVRLAELDILAGDAVASCCAI